MKTFYTTVVFMGKFLVVETKNVEGHKVSTSNAMIVDNKVVKCGEFCSLMYL